MNIIFVTGNEKKAEDAQNILGQTITIEPLELEEIQSLDLEAIAKHKADQAFHKLKKPLIVDDAGLSIDAWNGFPGPFIKYLKEAGGNQLLLKMLKNEKNRLAKAVGAIAYHDGNTIHTFTGEIKGSIATCIGGEDIGWEPIFIPEGYDKTWAELGDKIKNSHSQRKQALDKLKNFLNN